MDKERVKFYNRSDYFYSYMLNKALEKLRIFDFSKESKWFGLFLYTGSLK